ncbi:MAG: FimB/Mfa2 family fimbrial subunit [Rikenellaceae bacterium]|nr:FimB/Mfa2 family fimbrial subunit [Rikenellaceae bacterium]
MRDDLSDCGTTRLFVVFDPEMYELPDNEHRIDRVHVFVFNRQNQYITSYLGGPYDYLSGQIYEVPIDLDPGSYHFVAWTNSGEPFKTTPHISEFVPYVTTLNEIELYLDDGADNNYTEDVPDLHYGLLRAADVSASEFNDHTIYLIPDTYRINVTVQGLENSEDDYQFLIEDNNSHFSFDNYIVSGYSDVHHIRVAQLEDGELSASMRVFSLTNDHSIEHMGSSEHDDRSPVFSFSDLTTDETLYRDNLVKMIRKAYETAGKTVDFDKTYEFNIILSFDANMDVTVSVNGWSYKYNPTEL